MSTIEHDVARHYARGSLEQAILAGLAASMDPGHTIDHLAAVDEFHIGGREATAELAGRLELRAGLRILDVGCGIGGTARFLASRYRCQVTGVDLTPEYVAAGTSLNRRVALSDRIELRVANAADLPFDAASFDRATLLHVGMNIPDKRTVWNEIARVLEPGGLLAVYDVMRTGAGELRYPVPWAKTAALSFVERPEDYRGALQAAGFEVASERNRRDFALTFFRRAARAGADGVPPSLGLHLMMGEDATAKMTNMIDNLGRQSSRRHWPRM